MDRWMMIIVGALVAIGVTGSGPPESTAQDAGRASQPEIPREREDLAGDVYVRVVDPRGNVVTGVEVVATGYRDDRERRGRTNTEGRVHLPSDGLVPGFGRLIARTDGALGWAVLGTSPRETPAGTEGDPWTITLRPLSHRVEGLLLGPDGKPDSGVRVQVVALGRPGGPGVSYSQSPEETASPLGEAVTDGDGRYSLSLPEGATAAFMVLHPQRFAPLFGCDARLGTLKPITLTLAAGLAGTVREEGSGTPVAGARVSAQLIDASLAPAGGMYGTASTDAKGRYTIGGLQPGVYNLLFTADQKAGHRFTARAVEGVRVEAGKDTAADMVRIEGRRVAGSVVDVVTGRPLSGVLVGYYGAARPRTTATCMAAVTDVQGEFQFFIPPGPAFVYVMDRPPNRPWSEKELTVLADRDPEPVRLKVAAKGAAGLPATPPPAAR